LRNLQVRLGFTSFTAGRQEQNSLTSCVNRHCFRKTGQRNSVWTWGKKIKWIVKSTKTIARERRMDIEVNFSKLHLINWSNWSVRRSSQLWLQTSKHSDIIRIQGFTSNIIAENNHYLLVRNSQKKLCTATINFI